MGIAVTVVGLLLGVGSSSQPFRTLHSLSADARWLAGRQNVFRNGIHCMAEPQPGLVQPVTCP
jgi:hypothetical protein